MEGMQMIADRIVYLRKKLGLSQAQLATKLQITASAEGNYEQGRRLPSIDTLILMSEIFDVSLDYLLTGTEHASSNKQMDTVSTNHCPCATCYWTKK